MKKTIIVTLMLICFAVAFTHAQTLSVDEWTGVQWERLGNAGLTSTKLDVVSGVLTGISAVRDYAFDVDPKMYQYYEAYSEFLLEQNVVEEIVTTLDRYYEQNRNTHKYNDRVVTMILVIYGKYWWR